MKTNILQENEDRLQSKMGKAFLCERVVFRGRDLHHDLCEHDWFSLYLYGITGREFSDVEKTALNFIWSATSYPDPSIWPNNNSALAGSVRTTASLSLMSGMVVSEASLYGRRPDKRSIDFFLRAGKALDEGSSLEDFIELELRLYKRIYGYGRPLVNIDERIPHTINKMEELGLRKGRFFQLALDVYKYLNKKKGLSINVAALDAAICADCGFDANEYHLFMIPAFLAGMVPCYLESNEKPEGTFFPIRCESIVNKGKLRRAW
jgi:citrate synthase